MSRNRIQLEIAAVAKAAAGARRMDIEQPGWAGDVDPRKLNIACRAGCIVGQATGDFNTGHRNYGWTLRDAEQFGTFAFRKSNSPRACRRQRAKYRRLTRAWIPEILNRMSPERQAELLPQPV